MPIQISCSYFICYIKWQAAAAAVMLIQGIVPAFDILLVRTGRVSTDRKKKEEEEE